MPEHPRVPLPATVNLFGTERTIQVNHCRMPLCENYGVPARHQKSKPGPSADRDTAYRVNTTGQGQVATILCKACSENPPIKSNASIVSEINRLKDYGGMLSALEEVGCVNPNCPNHEISPADAPKQYYRRGITSKGLIRYQCKTCGGYFRQRRRASLNPDQQRQAADVFSRIANKSPVRGTIRGGRLASSEAYYRILDFIYDRCRAFSGKVDRALIDGRLHLPAKMTVQSDAQTYTLNWTSRLDRRNIIFSSYCTVDTRTRFNLGMQCNYDGRFDPFDINTEAARSGDMTQLEPFRRYAHYWLTGDDMRAGRNSRFANRDERSNLSKQIEQLYANAATREDVEDIELSYLDRTCTTPFLYGGLQIHMPYLAYAHWFLMHRLLTGAGVQRLQMNTDINSMTRSAFLCAFMDEVKEGRAHGFYVKYAKDCTIDERKAIMEQNKIKRGGMSNDLSTKEQWDLAREFMKIQLAKTKHYGKWHDLWVEHPIPTMNEPRKVMSWLTPDRNMDIDHKADMYLRAGLARIDNVFQMSRRAFHAFERPLTTASGQKTVWYGYQPYNPAMVEKYMCIFRTANNFITVGDDGKTPAMRLGFTNKPCSFEDILWDGERIPKPKRVRRKGKSTLKLPRAAA